MNYEIIQDNEQHHQRHDTNIVLPAILSLAGCSVPVAPSDVEMIRHFNVNEAAFNGIREVIARCPYGMYYPPYNMQEDTACLRGINTEDRHTLDSLLAVIDCERVFYFGKEAKKEAMTESGWYGHGIYQFFYPVLFAWLLCRRNKQGFCI